MEREKEGGKGGGLCFVTTMTVTPKKLKRKRKTKRKTKNKHVLYWSMLLGVRTRLTFTCLFLPPSLPPEKSPEQLVINFEIIVKKKKKKIAGAPEAYYYSNTFL